MDKPRLFGTSKEMAKAKRKTPEALAELIADEAAALKRSDVKHAVWDRRRAKREAEWRAARSTRYLGRKGPPRVAKVGGKPGWLVLWERMAPGAWHAFEDLCALMPEYARGSIRAWPYQLMPARGLIERAQRPDSEPWGVAGMTSGRYWYRRIEKRA